MSTPQQPVKPGDGRKSDPVSYSLGFLMERARKGLFESNPSKLLIISILIFVVILLVLLWVMKRVRRKDLQAQHIIKTPFKMYAGGTVSKPFVFGSGRIPTSKNGIEYTYTFWLYVSSFDVTTTPKLIFNRGFDSTFGTASPLVFMDAKNNALHFAMRTNQSHPSVNTLQGILDPANKFLVASIEYVPLQRWVQFALIIKENIITLMMDGEIYTVENVLDLATEEGKPIILPNSGDLMVGSLPGSSSLKGYITRFDVFNYAVDLAIVKALYKSGPFTGANSLMSKMGLGDYKLRAPIYKDTDENQTRSESHNKPE
jgi:hypothetical protein